MNGTIFVKSHHSFPKIYKELVRYYNKRFEKKMFTSFFYRSVDDQDDKVYDKVGSLVSATDKFYKIDDRVIDSDDDSESEDDEIVEITRSNAMDENDDYKVDDQDQVDDDDEETQTEPENESDETENEETESETEYDTIIQSVIKQFKDHSKMGFLKYGTTMDREDLTLLEWIQHAQEENMDAVIYLEKIKQCCSCNTNAINTITFKQKYQDDTKDFVVVVIAICFIISVISNVLLLAKRSDQ